MESKEFDLTAIRKKLPHGAISIIAMMAGVHVATVSRAFHGDKRSLELPKIIKATADYIQEMEKEEKEVQKAINVLAQLS